MKKILFTAIAGLAMISSASADEVWTTEEGEITYEREIEANQVAVFSGNGITMYIEGLAGVYTDRGAYSGIWVLDEAPSGEVGCPVAIVRPGTTNDTTAFWGQMEITFIDPDFPSIWIAQLGQCFDGMGETMIARPVVAQ